jgi:hypothetical protein
MGTEMLRHTQHDKPVHYLLESSNSRDVITSRIVIQPLDCHPERERSISRTRPQDALSHSA